MRPGDARSSQCPVRLGCGPRQGVGWAPKTLVVAAGILPKTVVGALVEEPVGVVVAPVVPFGVLVVPGVVVLNVVAPGVVVFGVGLVGVRVTIHDPTRNCSIRNGDAVDGVVGPVGVGVGVGVVVVCARASDE